MIYFSLPLYDLEKVSRSNPETLDLVLTAKEARKLRNQASRYIFYEGKLYKRSYSLPLLRCLHPSEADYALWEVHEGICENYLGARSLSHKLLHQGYYWPMMHHDSIEYVKKCDRC